MMRSIRLIAAVGLLGFGVVPAAQAQNAKADLGEAWIRARIGQGRDQKTDELRQQLHMQFYNSDIDGGGVSAKDYELAEIMDKAQQRASRIMQALTRDLDGDGIVTREEVALSFSRQARQPITANRVAVEPTPDQTKTILDHLVSEVMKADTNNDGKLSLEEMAAEPKDQRRRNEWYGRQQMVPLDLDTNGDGTVSIQEFDSVADRILGELDSDHDGTVSAQESAAFAAVSEKARLAAEVAERARLKIEELKKRGKACNFPAVPAGAKVLLIGTFAGSGLSTVSLGEEKYKTTVTDVEIEEGSEPLYIVASVFEPVIWRVSGATHRIKAFVTSSERAEEEGKKPLVGVVGLKPGTVHIVPAHSCIVSLDAASDALAADEREKNVDGAGSSASWETRSLEKKKQLFETMYGIKADVAVDSGEESESNPARNMMMGNLSLLKLPSGERSSAGPMKGAKSFSATGDAGVLWTRAVEMNRGGVIEIDPTAVVSLVPAHSYEVLPEEAGFAQLVENGTLIPTEWRHAFRENGSVSITGSHAQRASEPGYFRIPFEFRVTRKMRIPVHPAIFSMGDPRLYVPDDVPVPEGDAGSACVMRLSDGKLIKGQPCGKY